MALLEEVKNIDKNEDIKIDIEEIKEELKPNGFFDNEENISNLSEELKNEEKGEILSSLESSLNNAFDGLKTQDIFTLEDMKVLDLCNKLFDENRQEEIRQKTSTVAENISHEVNKDIGKNLEGNANYYSKEQIRNIQFRANMNFGENLELDGNRGSLFYSVKNSENQKKTNAYIYRLEFANRQDVIDIRPGSFDEILNIPNLEDNLGVLTNIEDQNKVFSAFLDFFLSVRISGMFFESKSLEIKNSAGENILSIMLSLMITRQQHAGSPDLLASELYNLTEQDILEYGDNVTVQEYCTLQTKKIQNHIKANLQQTIQINNQYAIQKEIQGLEVKNKKALEEIKKVMNISPEDWKSRYDEFSNKYKNIISDPAQIEEALYMQIWIEKSTELTFPQKAKIATYFQNKRDLDYRYAPMYYHEDLSVQIRKIFKKNEINKFFPNSSEEILRTHEDALFMRNYMAQELQDKYDVIDQIENNADGLSFSKVKGPTAYKNIKAYRKTYDAYSGYKNSPNPDIDAAHKYAKENGVDYMVAMFHLYKGVDLYSVKDTKGQKHRVNFYRFNEMYIDTDSPKFKDKKNFRYVLKNQIARDDDFPPKLTSRDFYLVCEDSDGVVHIYENPTIGRRQKKGGYAQGTEEEIGNIVEKNYDVMNTPEMQDIQNDLKTWGGKIGEITNALNKFNNKNLEEEDVEDIQATVRSFMGNGLNYMENQVPKMEEYIQFLNKMLAGTEGSYRSEQESGIFALKQNIESIVRLFDKKEGTDPDGNKTSVSSMRTMCEFMITDRFYSNDAWAKRARHRFAHEKGWVTVLSFVVAIATAVFTGGQSFWLLCLTAVASTGAGLLTNELLGALDDSRRTNYTIIDGKKYTVNTHRSRLTKVEAGELSRGEYGLELLIELGIGTASMIAFMGIGRIIGKQLSTIVATRSESGLAIFAKTLKPSQFSTEFLKNQTSKGISKQVSNSFLKKFGTELAQETGQEITESAAENVWGPLGMMVTIFNCISGRPDVNLMLKNKVTGGKTDISEDNKMYTTTFEYNGNSEEIINHYKEKGYEGKVLENGNLELVQSYGNGQYDHKFVFQKTKKPFFLRDFKNNFISGNNDFSGLFDIQEDLEQKHFLINDYASSKKINAFKKHMRSMGGCVIKDLPDGSFELINSKETILFKKPNIEAKLNTQENSINLEMQKVKSNIEEIRKIDPKEKPTSEKEKKVTLSMEKIKNNINNIKQQLQLYLDNIKRLPSQLSTTKGRMLFLDKTMETLHKTTSADMADYANGYPTSGGLRFQATLGLNVVTDLYNRARIELDKRSKSKSEIKFDGNYDTHVNKKLSSDVAKIPLKDGKHEYKLFDKSGNELDRNNLSEKQQLDLTVEAYKNSVHQDIPLLSDIKYVNKTGFAFSKDLKTPGDLDYAVEKDSGKIKSLVNKLIQAQENGEIKGLKLTHKIEQDNIIHEYINGSPSRKVSAEIDKMIEDKTLRIEYDGMVDVGVDGNQASINREIFIEDGQGMFEVDINKSVEVDIDGKKMSFLTPEGYVTYVQDLLVKDLSKDIGDGMKKLKIAKRIDDYIDLVTVQEKSDNKKTTVLTKLKNLIVGKRFSKNKTIKMLESLKLSRGYVDGDHPLNSEYIDAVNHFESVLTDNMDLDSGVMPLEKNVVNKVMNRTGVIKKEIKELNELIKSGYGGFEIQSRRKSISQKIDKLKEDLTQYDLTKDEAFPIFHELYLLTKTQTYQLQEVGSEFVDPYNQPEYYKNSEKWTEEMTEIMDRFPELKQDYVQEYFAEKQLYPLKWDNVLFYGANGFALKSWHNESAIKIKFLENYNNTEKDLLIEDLILESEMHTQWFDKFWIMKADKNTPKRVQDALDVFYISQVQQSPTTEMPIYNMELVEGLSLQTHQKLEKLNNLLNMEPQQISKRIMGKDIKESDVPKIKKQIEDIVANKDQYTDMKLLNEIELLIGDLSEIKFPKTKKAGDIETTPGLHVTIANISETILSKEEKLMLSDLVIYLKKQGYDHRDLHAGNIIRHKDGKLAIIDFGRSTSSNDLNIIVPSAGGDIIFDVHPESESLPYFTTPEGSTYINFEAEEIKNKFDGLQMSYDGDRIMIKYNGEEHTFRNVEELLSSEDLSPNISTFKQDLIKLINETKNKNNI